MAAAEPIIKMAKIEKSFPGVKALQQVDFELAAGEIHGLMGENGAGKSTLIKVLTGVYKADSGQIFLDGQPIRIKSPEHAQKIGISTVYQEVNLCPNLSVAENIFIGREPIKKGRIDWKKIKHEAETVLDKFDLTIDVDRKLSFYSVAVQQMVAIARALIISAKVIILDEPTASLDTDETNKLFEVMRQLKSEGIAIIYITHFLNNVYEITDRITILRNGELIDTCLTESLPRIDLISKMIGKDLEQIKEMENYSKNIGENNKVLLKAEGLASKGNIEAFDLELKEGEVLGLAGLLGAGRTEMVELLFGLNKADQGRIIIDGKEVKLNSPKDAVDYKIALCPENRKEAGLIGNLSVRENIILALQVTRGWFRKLSQARQLEIAQKYIDLINIKTPDTEQLVKNLSGGNQQKVVLARWLAINPDLLILDEPTKGIDIGTKADIQKLVLELASGEGMSVVFISSEIEEVTRISQRVVVLCDRAKIAELTGSEINQKEIMYRIAGGEA
jgi:simple sugar transport system ATP-binding protein